MRENHKSIDSYFESAEKHKTPISRDYATSLLEKSGSIINKSTFFSTKGVKTMTTITSIIIAGLIGWFGLYNNYDQVEKPLQLKKASPTKHESIKEKTALFNTDKQEIEKKDVAYHSNEKKQPIKENNFLQYSIKGLNTIKFNDEELEEFGIGHDSDIVENTKCSAIIFNDRLNKHSYQTTILSKGSGAFSIDSIRPDTKFIKIKPAFITNILDGSIRYSRFRFDSSNKLIDEFVSFNKNLKNLFDLKFPPDLWIDSVPSEIDRKMNDLNGLMDKYIESITSNIIGTQIDSILFDLNEYFSLFSFNDEIMKLEEQRDTLNQPDMILSDDLPPDDSSHLEIIKSMAERGIKVEFRQNPKKIVNYLYSLNKGLREKLLAINKQIEKYQMAGNLIPLDIRYKDDSTDGWIFWFEPTMKFINALPERYHEDLIAEFKLYESNEPYCGAPIDAEKAYMDVWRSCSGAIENLRIFPNPVKDMVSMKFELTEKRNITFTVHDLSGIRLKELSQEKHLQTGTNTFTFDLSELSSGMYLLVVSSQQGEHAVQRLIKE
ncbi:T9SS type A sorting domain-containing protein [Bacteroidota bacterium]